MLLLLLLCLSGLCQLACTGLAVSEMVISMWETKNATSDDFNETLFAFQETLQLFDDVATLKFMIHMLRYLRVIFPSLAFCMMVYVFRNRKQYKEVKSLFVPVGVHMMLQLIGVVGLVSRLVVLVLYTIDHVCEADGENLELNYILLGTATAFGFLSLFLSIGYLFTYIYKKCAEYENADKQRKCKTSILN